MKINTIWQRTRYPVHLYALAFLILTLSCLFSSCRNKEKKFSTGFTEPADPDIPPTGIWENVIPGLHGCIGTINRRYGHNVPPGISGPKIWKGRAWKGERKNIQIVLWETQNEENIRVAPSSLKSISGNLIPAANIIIHPVRYVITDEFLRGYGYRDPDTIPSHLVADPFENTNSFGIGTKTVRPVWITVDVPANAAPDEYRGEIIASSSKGDTMRFKIDLEVQDMTLPPPEEWSFHLDLWLNPFAVARYYHLQLWSPAFWDTLRPYVKMLAAAGQKSVMAIIIDQPWRSLPVYDPYHSMVKRVKKTDGSWQYDYSVFDEYVEFIQQCGITQQINCQTMATWGNEYRYYDERTGRDMDLQTAPGKPAYAAFWKPFLISFRAHLKAKGWLGKTCIAMDERSPEEVKEISVLVHRYVPELKIAMAINRFNPDMNKVVYDLSSIALAPLDTAIIRERSEKGFITDFYTCCAPPEHPNNFSFSPPADAAWLGWYAAAHGYSGFLRYAYNSWVKDPLADTRYRTWPAGDCFQVYPGPRSSIRFERLREGIQDFEKIRILKKKFSGMDNEAGETKLKELNNLLHQFTIGSLAVHPSENWLSRGDELLDRLSE